MKINRIDKYLKGRGNRHKAEDNNPCVNNGNKDSSYVTTVLDSNNINELISFLWLIKPLYFF